MDEMEEILSDLMEDETEGYLSRNIGRFDEEQDFYWDDEDEWDEE